ncbi:flagellar hook-associated protein FlgL [Undibacterium sp.]|jgi:flagellar hook-associated protein 3 FlgL|uniref:flagellar hook-associated protein FlgL n=1 Tax=Undibacterium sp. TaxID=1914977 RepID=UPI002CE0005B|nr:flagellar hook-associated protein FlgL [Undibacterium sp.]HTD04144.1 flagellar hook-associated protein FlgL [Undibacterium sp.]
MRIASTQFESTMLRSLQLNQGKTSSLTIQMSSGQKILLPSDDPITSVRLSRLTREEATISQYRDNIGALKIRLQKGEAYLTGMNNDMQEARDLLVWASDGGNATADLGSMVNSLQSLKDSLFYTANTKDTEGNYVFSGTATDKPTLAYDPAAAIGSRYSFTGNTAHQDVVVGNGITQAANTDLQGMETLLNQMDATIAALQVPGVSANNPAVRLVLADNLNGIDTAMGSVSVKIATFGGTQNILSTLDSNHGNVSLSNKTALLDLGELDYSAAAIDLNGYTMALQATQKAYAKVSGLSLFNVL